MERIEKIIGGVACSRTNWSREWGDIYGWINTPYPSKASQIAEARAIAAYRRETDRPESAAIWDYAAAMVESQDYIQIHGEEGEYFCKQDYSLRKIHPFEIADWEVR